MKYKIIVKTYQNSPEGLNNKTKKTNLGESNGAYSTVEAKPYIDLIKEQRKNNIKSAIKDFMSFLKEIKNGVAKETTELSQWIKDRLEKLNDRKVDDILDRMILEPSATQWQLALACAELGIDPRESTPCEKCGSCLFPISTYHVIYDDKRNEKIVCHHCYEKDENKRVLNSIAMTGVAGYPAFRDAWSTAYTNRKNKKN